MKFCPVCKTRYDEEILRFCTKDGAPLVDENPPNFTEMPSASYNADDLGEETVIRRNPKPNATIPAPLPDDFEDERSAANARNVKERIVIPTTEPAPEPPIRTKAVVYEQKRGSNTTKIVALTVIGTLVALTAVFGAFWAMRSPSSGNTNVNVNTNPYNISANSLNANADNSSFNFNAASNIGNISNSNANISGNINSNTNSNIGINFNIAKTPTPRPTATATPRPTVTPAGNTNSAVNANSNAAPTPTATPTPAPTPKVAPTVPRPSITPTPTPPPVNRPVNAGVLNGQAISLPKPAYPAPARAVRANGQVTVQVTLDENGTVTSAKALNGNPLLRQPAEAAARQSRFNPFRISGQAVPATGVLIYNFVN